MNQQLHSFAGWCATTMLGVAAACAAPPAPWTLIVLPDTQFYSETAARFPQFTAQTQWIVDNLARRNIAFVSHIGDIVQNGANGGNPVEWDRAVTAMNLIHGLVPYAACIGNHDYNTVSNKGTGSGAYDARFGPARYAGMAWYGGASANNQNHYQRFSASGRDYLHLALEWKPDAASLAWAQSIITANPGLPTILSTHEHVQDGDTAGNGAGRSAAGDITWDTLIRSNPQVFMALNGHFHRGTAGHDGEHHLDSRDDGGLEVFEMLGDYQAWPNGGNGYLRILRFDERNGLIRVRAFSPTLSRFESDANSTLTLPLDFGARFNASAPKQRNLSFREGASGYTGTLDAQLSFSTPATPNGSGAAVSVDSSDGSPAGPTHALIRFDNLFGEGEGQIAPTSDVIVARLRLQVVNAGSGLQAHRMRVPWDESATWDSLAAGVSADGIDASGFADMVAGANVVASVVPLAALDLDVTPSFRAWMNGAPNHGWALLPFAGGSDGVDFNSSEYPAIDGRPELIVTVPNRPVQIATFRAGMAGYAGAQDTELRQADPALDSGGQPTISIDSDEPVGTAGDTQALLRFDDLFGEGPGQVPALARVTSAVLILNITDDGSGFTLHRMLRDWNESSTWDALAGGVTANDVEAGIRAEAGAGANLSTAQVRAGALHLDVTESVQDWIAGEPNRGWVLRPFSAASNGLDFASSQHPTESSRPTLIIRFVPPPPPCEGDADGDHDRDFADVTSVLANFTFTGPPFRPGDADGDGDVDFADVTAVLANFSVACP